MTVKDIGRVVTGRTPPTKITDYFGDEYPFVTPSDMRSEKWISKTDRGLSSKGASLLKRNRVPANSVVVSCIGWQMGKVAKVRYDSFTNQQINSIIPHGSVDSDFLHYSLSTRREELKTLGSVGTRTPILNKSRFEELTVSLPPLPIQQKIASVLSAYDDLIENNTRRIEILEEMAQAIYREWFVNFRFPGHEKVGMVESELGPIPEGWEAKSLGEVCSYINRGIAPKYDDESESIVVNQKCVRNGRLNLGLARRHSKRVPPEKLIRFGDGLINSTGVGTLGRVTQVYIDIEKTTVDSHVSIIRPSNQLTVDYFGLALLNLQSQFEHMGQGATGQTELNRQSISNTLVVVPDSSIQESFSKIIAPMRRNAVLLDTKNTNLRHTRNLLLPKLISGEVDIEAVDIEAEADELVMRK